MSVSYEFSMRSKKGGAVFNVRARKNKKKHPPCMMTQPAARMEAV